VALKRECARYNWRALSGPGRKCSAERCAESATRRVAAPATVDATCAVWFEDVTDCVRKFVAT
jgi:hypothetical protein